MTKTLTFLLTLFTTTCTIGQTTTKQVILPAGTVTAAQVPEGVTSLTIEAWGAGGGGSILGGGQGGGYFKSTVPVKAGDYLAVHVDAGGNGGIATGINGGNTTIEIKRIPHNTTDTQLLYKFVAEGGAGAHNGTPRGSYRDTNRIHGFARPIDYPFIGYTGGNGSATTVTNLTQGKEEYSIGSSVGGNGGNGANTSNTKGTGGSETRTLYKSSGGIPSYTASSINPFTNDTEPLPGLVPGGGGGGATSFYQSNKGANGGGGLLIISFTN